MDIEIIRKAILKNRGGLSKASNAQIMIIWNSLDKTTQEKYLESVKKSEAKTQKTEER